MAGFQVTTEEFRTPVQFVFEDGDLDKHKLRELFNLEGWPDPISRPPKDRLKNSVLVPGFIPLQAADILANELFQLCPQIPNVRTPDLAQ